MTDNYTMPDIRAPMTDPKTGLPEKCWYLYLNNLFGSAGSGLVGGTTQVLHGGGVGYSQVNLTADVTGTLPVTKGGTGTVSQFPSGSVVFTSTNGVYASDTKLTFNGTSLLSRNLGVSTGNISSLTVSSIIVPAIEFSGTNSTPVTVDISGTTVLASINLGNLNTGTRIEVNGIGFFVKGGTTGESVVVVKQSAGTATINAYHNNSQLVGDDIEQPAGSSRSITLNGIVKVTGGGSLSLTLYGFSVGSNSTVTTGTGQIYALILNNT